MTDERANDFQAIRDAFEQVQTFDQMARLLDREWPNDMYKKTTEETGKPANIGIGDIGFVMDPGDQGKKGLAKEIIRRFPEMDTIATTKLEAGKPEFINCRSTIQTSRGGSEERSRYLYVLPFAIAKDGTNNMAEFHGLINKWKYWIKAHDREKGERVTVKHLIPAHRVKPTAKPKAQGKPKRMEDRVPIKTKGGKSYAYLRKSVKDRVDINKIGVKEKQIRKTHTRDILLVERRRPESGGTKSPRYERRSLMPIGNNDVIIRGFRVTRSGSQTATLEVGKEKAQELSRLQRIKIGWTSYKIAVKIQGVRRVRCLDFGHSSHNCKGPNRADDFIKYGKTGHSQKLYKRSLLHEVSG